MKTPTFKLLSIAISTVLTLTACGSDNNTGNGNQTLPKNTNKSMTGQVTDITAPNIRYTTSSGLKGTLDNNQFSYNEGDSITFYIGGMKLTKVNATDSLQLLGKISANGSAFSDKSQYPAKVSQLLMSADEDSSKDSNIEFGESFLMWANSQTDPISENSNPTTWTEQAGKTLPVTKQEAWQQAVVAMTSNAPTILPIVASGNHHTYAMGTDGMVVSFGEDYLKWLDKKAGTYIGGKLGRATDSLYDSKATADSDAQTIALRQYRYNPIPSKVDGLNGLKVSSLTSGQNDGAVITKDGELYMWGPNNRGQLGTGDTEQRRSAIKVNVDGKKVHQVAIGGSHTHAITDDGALYSWGYYSAPLGLGENVKSTKENVTTPTLVDLGGEKAMKVVTDANRTTFILTTMGKVIAMGSDSQGQLANGKERQDAYTPEIMDLSPIGNASVVDIAVGSSNVFLVTDDGKVYGAGQTSQGHTGRVIDGAVIDNGAVTSDDINKEKLTNLTLLPVFDNVQQLVAGSRHVLFLTKDQKVYAIGKNPPSQGILGIGYPQGKWVQNQKTKKWSWKEKTYVVPQEVTALSDKNIINLNSVTINSYAVSATGEVYGWGNMDGGRLAMGEHNCHAVITPAKTSIEAGKDFAITREYMCYQPTLLDLSTTQSDLHTGKKAETTELPALPEIPVS